MYRQLTHLLDPICPKSPRFTHVVPAHPRGFRSDPQPPSATGRSYPNSTDFAHGHSPSHHHNVAPQLYRFPLGYGPLTVSAFVLSK